MPLIGVISDTHDQVNHLGRAIEYFQSRDIVALIHCGDWISPFTLGYFKPLAVPIYGVFGNNDGDLFRHGRVANSLELDLEIDDTLLTPTLYNRTLAIYHGTAPKLVDALVKCGDYDAVFYGHNHQPSISHRGQTLAMNPGTLMDYTTADKVGSSIGLYKPDTNQGELIALTEI